MYKDKEKQREANKEAAQRGRDKQKGMTQDAIVIPDHPVPVIPKRGKDIRRFEDLPPDVQQTIERISDSPEEKQGRTAIAISYQHTYPDRYETKGLPVAST